MDFENGRIFCWSVGRGSRIKESSSYITGIVKVEFDKSKVTEEQLKKVIEEKVGYKVKSFEVNDEREN